MEDIYELSKFFPSGTNDDQLNQYLDHHLTSVARCVESGLYSSAYSHLHLLYMSFIYIQLLRIAKEKKVEFKYGWIGFPGQEKDYLNNPRSPFSFSILNEKTVFRFFRLVDFNDADIGDIAKPVKTRNDRMHARGDIHCADIKSFEGELCEYIRQMKSVISRQQPFLADIYKGLISTYDEDYEFTQDDLESNFQDQYLLSEYELLFLAGNRQDKVSKFIREVY